jgi:hypothetical protein
MHHLIGRKPQHGIARSCEHPIAPRIRGAAPLVHRTVDFHDQANARSNQIGDEAIAERNLTLEGNRQIRSRDALPQALLARRRRMQHAPSAKDELGRASVVAGVDEMTHGEPPARGVRPSAAPMAQGACQRPVVLGEHRRRWRATCASSEARPHAARRSRAAARPRRNYATEQSDQRTDSITLQSAKARCVSDLGETSQPARRPPPPGRAGGARKPRAQAAMVICGMITV